MKFSPRAVALLLVALIAGGILLVGLAGRGDSSPAGQQASHQAEPAEKHGDDSVWTPSAEPTGEVDRVALVDSFARLWARPDVPGARWVAELRPYMTPDLTGQLTGLDPATGVPASQVTGSPVKMPGETGQYSIAVTGAQDGPANLIVTVVDLPGGPRAAAIDYALAGETK